MRLPLSGLLCAVSGFLIVSSSPSPTTNVTEEDKYIKYYHNDPYAHRCWAPLRDVYYAKEKPHLKLMCSEFHKLAGKGSATIDTVKMTINILRFRTPGYFPARIDVVTYGINDTDQQRVNYYYITEGLKSHCAYYLKPCKIVNDWPEFLLDQHVCGIPLSMFEW